MPPERHHLKTFSRGELMGKVARVRGIEMAYDDEGRGPAVVLLHGFPFNRSMWREQVEALRASHRVVAPDMRGFGETAAAREASTMEEMAEDVAALLDELKIERAVVCGLSATSR
jgi:pimeloyl-ACP methyl ester carboxylesterase